ncbi:hypothetical protein Q4E93_13065 [Flavitalea sp. BT771]|uniref:hypothetical protein n=1 Tax=Flavitalea sp. BT771 TaxID=3063329 RepID=UPI0026E1B26D|nr:hypothetical protein [Flavitalea sp. BT771]MDO6431528.1 hypothetical protein [Flavitalea sp. BT771]MDV6220436.1 hypothetical protein [Flavitalea sp. BT771]
MEDILLKDYVENIDKSFVEHGWLTAIRSGNDDKDGTQVSIFSAIVDEDKIKEALEHRDWELRYGHGRPGITTYFKEGKGEDVYRRFGTTGFEPIIYYRDQFGGRKRYFEFSEEFRLYFNLYEVYHSPQKKDYIFVNDNGDEDVVAKIDDGIGTIKLKFLKEYLSIRKKYLLIYFDIMRFSDKTLQQLNMSKINQNYKSDKHCFNHLVTEDLNDSKKVTSWLAGKCTIEPINGFKYTNSVMELGEKYTDFIIGYDDNGEGNVFSCDDRLLGNYFGANPGAPLYVTSVYFKKEVLKKYYDNPAKYLVEDGCVRCNGSWILRMDNNNAEYIIVMLGDLGDLHLSEQLYWKSYNIAPLKGGLSITAYKRFMEGVPYIPSEPDHLLKYVLESFNKEWKTVFGWELFKPLNPGDSHYLTGLHLLTTPDNGKELDEQVLALTKIFIDSLNEKELGAGLTKAKPNAKGIDKLEEFLESKGVPCSDMIEFFRKLQALRSTTTAHRRSSVTKDIKKIFDYFEINQLSKAEVLRSMFLNLITTLNTIGKYFGLNMKVDL